MNKKEDKEMNQSNLKRKHITELMALVPAHENKTAAREYLNEIARLFDEYKNIEVIAKIKDVSEMVIRRALFGESNIIPQNPTIREKLNLPEIVTRTVRRKAKGRPTIKEYFFSDVEQCPKCALPLIQYSRTINQWGIIFRIDQGQDKFRICKYCYSCGDKLEKWVYKRS